MPTNPDDLFAAAGRSLSTAGSFAGGAEEPAAPAPVNPDEQFAGGPDAMLDTLMKQYGLTLKQAAAYAQKLEGGGQVTGGREIQGEAVKAVADRELTRLKRINYYADVSKRYYTGQPVSEEDKNYLAAVHQRQHDTAIQQAKQALQEQAPRQLQVTAGPAQVLPPVKNGWADVQRVGWSKQGPEQPEDPARWAALQAQTAAHDYRETLNANANLGPPGPNAGQSLAADDLHKMDPKMKTKLLMALLSGKDK